MARKATQDGLVIEGLASILSTFGLPEAIPEFKACITLMNYTIHIPKGVPRFLGKIFLLAGEESKQR